MLTALVMPFVTSCGDDDGSGNIKNGELISKAILPLTKDMIAGRTFTVKSYTIERGSNSSIQNGKTIRFNEDGTCEGFHSMENAWNISEGKLSTYYKKTNEPMYVYMLISNKDNELTVRMNGTLDDDFQATLVLVVKVKDNESATQTTVETYWTNKDAVLSARNACYSNCAEFEQNQLNMEKVRTNPNTVHNLTPTSIEVRKTWESAYRTITMTNYIMDNVAKFQSFFGSQELNNVLAEVRFIRAFVYYNIAMLWGNVPKPITASVDVGNVNPPSQQDEVYHFVYSELNEILNYLTQTEDKRVVSLDAGRMLMAELEMTRGNLTQARNYISQIDMSRYVTTRSTIDGTPGTSVIWALSPEAERHTPIYTYNQLLLYQKESSSNKTGLETEWQNSQSAEYGYWAALKRLGKAQELTNCYDYELLMPFPYDYILSDMTAKQNPGY